MYELFEQKYKECEKSLFLVAVGYLHNTEDAKDCVQEAVISALNSFNRMKNIKYFKTWITRIVINKCKDFLKRKKYTEALTDTMNIFYNMPTEEMELLDCILKINPQLTVYITLRFYNEMTYAEAAKALGQPVSTVKYKTKKALLELKKHLEGEDFNENI